MQNKLKKLPTPVQEQDARQFQKRRQQLDQMAKENKDTIDLIDKLKHSTAANSKKSTKEIENLQIGLKQLVFRMDVETKKNKALKELIELTNHTLLTSKKEGKYDSTQLYSTREKQVKKEQYDIEQILQKHNEQVAKINVLKQQVSFSRRERVVYSNLFKKIQKEIKVYQEKFKETLLNTFQTENKKRQISDQIIIRRKISERMTYSTRVNHRASIMSSRPQPTNDGKKFTHIEHIRTNSVDNSDQFFITNTAAQNKSRQISVVTQYKRSNKTHKVNQQMQKYISFFNALKVHIKSKDCTFEEMMDEINGIEDQNDRLKDEIQHTNDLISICSADVNNYRRKLSQFNDQYRNNKFAQEISCSTSPQQLQEQVQMQRQLLEKDLTLMKQLYKMLNVEDSQEGDHFNVENIHDCFRLIQEKVNQLSTFQLEGGVMTSRHQNQELNIRRIHLQDNEHHIETIIEKLDRYNESEKILSKQAFQQESKKELFKLRKLKVRRDK